MKKVFRKSLFVFLTLFLILSLISFVIAQEAGSTVGGGEGVDVTVGDAAVFGEEVGSGVIGFFQGFLKPIFGVADGKFWGARILLFVLLFLVIWTIVPYLFGKKHKTLNFAITLTITSLAIIALPADFYGAILAQYGAMGATILATIPFIIILVFSLMVEQSIIARVVWLFYVFYYVGFYIYLTIQIFIVKGEWVLISTKVPNTLPYLIALFAGIIIFTTIGPLRDAIFKGKMGALREAGENIAERGGVLAKIDKRKEEEILDV